MKKQEYNGLIHKLNRERTVAVIDTGNGFVIQFKRKAKKTDSDSPYITVKDGFTTTEIPISYEAGEALSDLLPRMIEKKEWNDFLSSGNVEFVHSKSSEEMQKVTFETGNIHDK